MTELTLVPATVVPNGEVVVMLEALLEQARSGQLISLVACGEMRGQESMTVLGGDIDIIHCLGILDVLRMRMHSAIRCEPED